MLFETSATADDVSAALDAAGLEFVELIQSAPRVALPKSHPMVNAESLTLEDMEDFPYLYFEQDEDSPVAFAEEALADAPRAKSIACTDRASLSELIVALNGYTVTSGILVGISTAPASTPCRSTPTCSCASATWCVGRRAWRDRPALRGHPQEKPREVRTVLAANAGDAKRAGGGRMSAPPVHVWRREGRQPSANRRRPRGGWRRGGRGGRGPPARSTASSLGTSSRGFVSHFACTRSRRSRWARASLGRR